MIWEVRIGDCVELMRGMEPCSVDAVVCDPPYGLEFMGRSWDKLTPEGGRADLKDRTNFAPTKSEFKDGVGTKVGAPQKNPRCRKCGKLKFDHDKGKCRCAAPDWNTRQSEYAYLQQVWHEAWATEALRVLKPGGHLLAFGGSRTSHRLACAIEDAGFEIRDTIAWMYGSGFPKSLDVSKAIDRQNGRKFEDRYALGRHIRERREAAELSQADVNGWFGYRDGCQHWERQDTSGARVPRLADWPRLREGLGLSDEFLPLVEREEAEREAIGRNERKAGWFTAQDGHDITAPATPEAEQWQGWGTALKPAHEPVVVARKPLSGTVAQTVLEHGTGGLNVDGCRVGDNPGWSYPNGAGGNTFHGQDRRTDPEVSSAGRWPANVVLDEESAALLDEQTGELTSGKEAAGGHRRNQDADRMVYGSYEGQETAGVLYGDSSAASRFYFCAKSSRRERNAGLDGFEEKPAGGHVRSQDEGTYMEFVHPAPEGIGAWLRQAREAAALTAKTLTGMVGAHGAVNHGGAVTNWEAEYNRPTPDQWWKLKAALGLDDRYDTVMTEQREVVRELFDDKPRQRAQNVHPTVKPIQLMRWLVRLVTPPGGTVLDPFAGSGTTGCAAALEGFDFIGCEREEEYARIAKARISWWEKHRGDGEAAEILAAGEARDRVEATGQLGMFDEPVPVDRANRQGEASAERRYTDRGGSNFAMKPGKRRP